MEKNQRNELEAVVSFGRADVPASFNLLIFGRNSCGNSGGQFAAALASKLLGRSEQRAAEVFRFLMSWVASVYRLEMGAEKSVG